MVEVADYDGYTETHINENPSPTRYPWDMGFQRDSETNTVIISVRGGGGGKKACFKVNYDELKTAVDSLKPAPECGVDCHC
jgi:hypothetical protein